MQLTKISTVDVDDLDFLAGELEHALDLLTVFSNWFEMSHKTDDKPRERTDKDLEQAWIEAPMYMSVLRSAVGSVNGVINNLDSTINEELGTEVSA
mgnify:FL=1